MLKEPIGTGVKDSALACCAGNPGSIPALCIVELQYSNDFSPSPVLGGIGKKRNQT